MLVTTDLPLCREIGLLHLSRSSRIGWLGFETIMAQIPESWATSAAKCDTTCMYIYTYIYIYLYVYMYVFISVYMLMYIYTYTCICMHIHILCVYVYVSLL